MLTVAQSDTGAAYNSLSSRRSNGWFSPALYQCGAIASVCADVQSRGLELSPRMSVGASSVANTQGAIRLTVAGHSRTKR